jgi:hypothetical protein
MRIENITSIVLQELEHIQSHKKKFIKNKFKDANKILDEYIRTENHYAFLPIDGKEWFGFEIGKNASINECEFLINNCKFLALMPKKIFDQFIESVKSGRFEFYMVVIFTSSYFYIIDTQYVERKGLGVQDLSPFAFRKN